MTEKEMTTDVLVIGAGSAGFAAALSADQHGAKVILAEKESQVGGSTAISGGGISAPGTRFQREQGIKDSKDSWLKLWHEREDTPDHSNRYPDYDLVNYYMDEAVKTTEWLVDYCGHKYEEINGFGVDKVKRIHYAVKNGGLGGPVLIKNLSKTAKEKEIPVLTNLDAKLLIKDSSKIVGAIFDNNGQKVVIHSKVVILATGGFAKNEKLLNQYVPQMKSAFKHCFAGAGATGSGIMLAKNAGGQLTETPWILGCGLALNIPHSFMLSMDWSKIYVNGDGERFINEESHYAIIANKVAAQKDPWLLLDASPANEKEIGIVKQGLASGETVEAESIANLAKKMKVPANKLEKTIAQYNEFAKSGIDPLGKEKQYLLPVKEKTFYAVKIYPQMMGTIGGVKINHKFEVTDVNGKAIPGLFACGETANGMLYNNVYMSGGSVQYSLTSGRIAGKVAAEA